MIATLRWNTMRVDGARFRAGERFTVAREFTAMGDNGPVRCLTLVHPNGEFAMQVDKDDVDLSEE